MRHIAALALALAIAAPVQADVVYNWETITPVTNEWSNLMRPLEGRMVFDDSGANEYGFICESTKLQCNSPDMSSPLLLLEFGALTFRPRETGNVSYFVDVGDSVHFGPYGTYMNTSYFWLVISYDNASGISTVQHSQLDGTPDYHAGTTGRWVLEQAAAVPLPGTLALLGIGLLAVGGVRLRGSCGGRGSELTCV